MLLFFLDAAIGVNTPIKTNWENEWQDGREENLISKCS